MLNAYIMFPYHIGLTLFPKRLSVRNGKEIFELVADGKIEIFDILDIKGIGKLFIRDIRLFNGNSMLIDCALSGQISEEEEEDDIWRMV